MKRNLDVVDTFVGRIYRRRTKKVPAAPEACASLFRKLPRG
jgi:hypothetical protein